MIKHIYARWYKAKIVTYAKVKSRSGYPYNSKSTTQFVLCRFSMKFHFSSTLLHEWFSAMHHYLNDEPNKNTITRYTILSIQIDQQNSCDKIWSCFMTLPPPFFIGGVCQYSIISTFSPSEGLLQESKIVWHLIDQWRSRQPPHLLLAIKSSTSNDMTHIPAFFSTCTLSLEYLIS